MFLEPTLPMTVFAQSPLPAATGEVCVPEFVVYATFGAMGAMGTAIIALWRAGKARDNQFIDYLSKDHEGRAS